MNPTTMLRQVAARLAERATGYGPKLMPQVSEGTASAQRINAAPLPVRCPFHPDLCNWPEGECAGLCSLKRPQP